MDNRKLFAGLLLGSALLVACEQRPEATPSGRNNPPSNTRNGMSSTVTDQNAEVRAQTLIEQVNRHIRNKEYDAAETSLSELESMKSSLSQSMQTQITSLRTTLNAARASSTVNTTPPSTSTPPDTDMPSSNPPTTTTPPANP